MSLENTSDILFDTNRKQKNEITLPVRLRYEWFNVGPTTKEASLPVEAHRGSVSACCHPWTTSACTLDWSKEAEQNTKTQHTTVFRCLSPFNIGIHISLEQSVWADLSWNPFRKRKASICSGSNQSGKKFRGKIWIFEKVTFKISAEIGFFGLTWRVTLL